MADSLAPTYIIGLDLGERRDYTALAVLQQRTTPTGNTARLAAGFDLERGQHYDRVPDVAATYDVSHLDRWRGEGYSGLPAKLDGLLVALHATARHVQAKAGRYYPVKPTIHLLVDHTGVGVAIVESIRKAGIGCLGVTIHGGDAVNRTGADFRIPKRDLVASVQVLLEQRRLRIAAGLPLAPVITAEFENFQAKKAVLTGHDSYGAGADWREGNHDDLVLAVAMAAWFGEHQPTGDAPMHSWLPDGDDDDDDDARAWLQ